MERRLTNEGKATRSANGHPPELNVGLREILTKSSRLMASVGYHGTSMRALSRATDRSLSGLYHYFHSKEDLLYLINYHGFNTLNDTWHRMAKSFDLPREKLYGFIYLHTHYYISNIDEMRVMNWGTQALAYEKAMTIRKLKDQHAADARAIVREVYESETGHEMEPKALARQTFLLFGMMNWIFGWYSSRAHGKVEVLIKDIYRTFVHGIDCDEASGSDMDAIEAVVRKAFAQSRPTTLWDGAQPAPEHRE